MGAGPLRLLEAGLVDRLKDAGHVTDVSIVETPSTLWPSEIASAFDLARQIAVQVRAALDKGGFPLVLSGNCGPAALGSVSAASDLSRVNWFDAHGDFNTPETTVSGFLDGMALATITGHCWRELTATIPGFSIVPEATVTLIGARDFDVLEANALADSQIANVSVNTIITSPASAGGNGSTYLHIDLDVLDPSEGRMNSYAAPRGITHSQLHEALHAIRRHRRLCAASVTAFDPAVDASGRSLETALNVCVQVAALGMVE